MFATDKFLIHIFDVISWHPCNQVVRVRRRLQCNGNGTTRAVARGPIQLLLPTLLVKDCAAAGRSTHHSY